VDEPTARVSRRGFLVALALTVVALPLLVLSGLGQATDDVPPPADPTSEIAAAAPGVRRTASFEEGQASSADLADGTCKHRTIAFETVVRVTNVTSGASTTCVVTARGPYVAGRIIELDRTVFGELATPSAAVVTVRIEW